jgi:hypothetical protein
MAKETVMEITVHRKSRTPIKPRSRPPFTGEEIDEIIKRSDAGDRGCLPDVRNLLADPVDGPNFRECVGSSVQWLLSTLIKKSAGKSVLGGEAIEQQLGRIRSELEGPNPTPIERLLAERASLCWFIVYWHENVYFNADGWSINQADLQDRKIDKAHARFLSAVRTLAQVRKLALPMLQLNIGTNQVNVAETQS